MATLTNLVSFGTGNGANPRGTLIADANGDLFGTTENGGANNDGTVYEIARTATGYATTVNTILVSFGGANGHEPGGRAVRRRQRRPVRHDRLWRGQQRRRRSSRFHEHRRHLRHRAHDAHQLHRPLCQRSRRPCWSRTRAGTCSARHENTAVPAGEWRACSSSSGPPAAYAPASSNSLYTFNGAGTNTTRRLTGLVVPTAMRATCSGRRSATVATSNYGRRSSRSPRPRPGTPPRRLPS